MRLGVTLVSGYAAKIMQDAKMHVLGFRVEGLGFRVQRDSECFHWSAMIAHAKRRRLNSAKSHNMK